MVGAGNYRAHGPNPACELFLLSFQTKNSFYTEKRKRICNRKRIICIWLTKPKIFNISLLIEKGSYFRPSGRLVKVYCAIPILLCA